MENTNGARITCEYQMSVGFPSELIFPLLCPVREYDWIPAWSCRLVYSGSGYAEMGCVFQTDFGDHYGPETWVISQYDQNRRIAFVRTGQIRTTRYEVVLKEGEKGTVITWRQEITGLTEDGNETIAQQAEEEFYTVMHTLEQLLNDYLIRAANSSEH